MTGHWWLLMSASIDARAPAMTGRRLTPILIAIVVMYLLLGGLYAALTPPWQVPDEPAHYNYVAQIAGAGRCCPVITPSDWDSPYLEELKAEQFPEDADLSTIGYEDHQPPLYYLLAWPVFLATGGDLLALRLFSVLLGAGVVLAAYGVVRRLFPQNGVLALATAAFVAFVPQHLAMMAGVNNDSLAELIAGLLLFVAIGYVQSAHRRWTHPAVIGALVGMAFLTKLTIYGPALAVAGLAVLLRWRIERRSVGWLAGQVAWVAGIALVLGALWWGRNLAVYGWPDLLAQQAHEAAVAGQLRTADVIVVMGFGPYLQFMLSTAYHSFWGQFGWMAVPLPPREYLLLSMFLLVALAGVVALIATGRLRTLDRRQQAGLGIMAGAIAATVAGFFYYNLTFLQPQGRYLFPALIPIAVLAVSGLWGWVRLIRHWLGSRLVAWLPLLGTIWLALYALWALLRHLVPNLD